MNLLIVSIMFHHYSASSTMDFTAAKLLTDSFLSVLFADSRTVMAILGRFPNP